ncbi:hypothetical protein ES703_92379 [subsurface metagenome]
MAQDDGLEVFDRIDEKAVVIEGAVLRLPRPQESPVGIGNIGGHTGEFQAVDMPVGWHIDVDEVAAQLPAEAYLK